MSVATYEEVVDLPNQPGKLLIDVRNPNEIADTGKIPTSVNIPFTQLEDSLQLNDEQFRERFGRPKPTQGADLIFHCGKGGRAQKATDLARTLGYGNARTYKGSYTEWASRQGK